MPGIHARVHGNIKPNWLRTALRTGEQFAFVARVVDEHALNTICSSGRCPNKAECWSNRTATLMIMGDVCTRFCRFCATASGKPLPLRADEPQRVADSISMMGLRHAVVTSVTRDDLPDCGAAHWARTVEVIRRANPRTTIEVLIPDMGGEARHIRTIVDSRPDILGHNVECVERLTARVRSGAAYATSLRTLAHAAACAGAEGLTGAQSVPARVAAVASVENGTASACEPSEASSPTEAGSSRTARCRSAEGGNSAQAVRPGREDRSPQLAKPKTAAGVVTKSGLMVGLGEKPAEVIRTMRDLREAGVSIVTIGQYLQPSPRHMAVAEYVAPQQFDDYRAAALEMGFRYVASAPLVRSSYMAHRAAEACNIT